MLEYHERNKRPAPTPEANIADLDTGEMQKFMSIAVKYGINDIDISGSGGNDQTLKQEYQVYITALLSSKTVNILKFWEVGDFVIDISVLLMGHSG